MLDQAKNTSLVGKLSKLALGTLFFLLIAYLALGFAFDRNFFARDAREKYGRVLGATTLSLRVIGPPEKPVLSAESLCTYLGAPYVHLTWAATRDTDYYDLSRDLNPLVAGIATTEYDDEAVAPSTSYSYLITAFGPAGQTASDPVVATTNLCSALPDPTCEITALNSLPLSGYPAPPVLTTPQPLFSGTTNMADALISISLSGPSLVSANATADPSGFWSWQPLTALNPGTYILNVTATDPSEPSRTQSTALTFILSAPPAADEDEDDDDDSDETASTDVAATILPTPLSGAPASSSPTPAVFTLKLAVQNPDSLVYAGQDLKTSLTILSQADFSLRDQVLEYFVVDPKGTIIQQTRVAKNIFDGAVIQHNLSLPRLLKDGRYKVIVQTENAGTTLSAESSFLFREPPLIVAGPVRFTLTQLTQNLGWTISILILLLLILFLLLSIEYWLYMHAQIHITEKLLGGQGLLGKGKGVLR